MNGSHSTTEWVYIPAACLVWYDSSSRATDRATTERNSFTLVGLLSKRLLPFRWVNTCYILSVRADEQQSDSDRRKLTHTVLVEIYISYDDRYIFSLGQIVV